MPNIFSVVSNFCNPNPVTLLIRNLILLLALVYIVYCTLSLVEEGRVDINTMFKNNIDSL